MANTFKINIEVLAEINKSLKSIERLQRTTTKSFKRMERDTKGFGRALKDIGKIAAGVLARDVISGSIQTLAQGFRDVVREAQELENSLIGLRSVAAGTGNDVAKIEAAAKDLAKDGLIPLSEVSASLKNLLAFGATGDEAVQVFNTLKNAAAFNRQGQLALGEAVKGATDGIKNQNSILVDNAGITKNLSVLQKEYAASIGKTIGQLTDAEKRQAIINGLIREGRLFQGDYNKLLQTFSGVTSRASGATKFFQAELGTLITGNKTAIAVIGKVGEVIQRYTDLLKANGSEGSKLVSGTIRQIITALRILTTIVDGVVRVFDLLTETLALAAINIIKPFVGIASFFNSDFKTALNNLEEVSKKTAKNVRTAFTRDTALGELNKILKELGKTANSSFGQVSRSAQKAAKAVKDINVDSSAVENVKKIREELDKVRKGLRTPREVIQDELNDRLSAIKAAADAKKISDQEAAELEFRARRDFEEKLLKIRSKRSFEFFNAPLKGLLDPTATNQDQGAAALGVGVSALQGAQGAVKLLSGAVTLVASKFLGPFGQVVGQIFEVFAQGPEQVRKMISEFLMAIPEILVNVVLAATEVIDTVAEKLPEMLQRLVDRAPEIIEAIIRHTPRLMTFLGAQMPRIATIFAIELIKKLPEIVAGAIDAFISEAPRFVDALIDAITGIGGGILGGAGDSGVIGGGIVGGFGGAIVGGIGDLFGFQDGGEIPNLAQFQNDGALIRASAGENVVDRSTNEKLNAFLDGQGGGGEQQLTINLVVGQDQLASTILNLNRQGFRLS